MDCNDVDAAATYDLIGPEYGGCRIFCCSEFGVKSIVEDNGAVGAVKFDLWSSSEVDACGICGGCKVRRMFGTVGKDAGCILGGDTMFTVL